ncbi:hypothetical protein C8J57DRAFT_1524310 [Mycena rebaudengoi]|nr:hypothetical protein C8J57DRAFT_1524310 [Mycena rebaudengoi]
MISTESKEDPSSTFISFIRTSQHHQHSRPHGRGSDPSLSGSKDGVCPAWPRHSLVSAIPNTNSTGSDELDDLPELVDGDYDFTQDFALQLSFTSTKPISTEFTPYIFVTYDVACQFGRFQNLSIAKL